MAPEETEALSKAVRRLIDKQEEVRMVYVQALMKHISTATNAITGTIARRPSL